LGSQGSPDVQLNADDILAKALLALDIDLPALVAATSVWASPEIVHARRAIHPDAAVYPDVRRSKRAQGEVRRTRGADGAKLDDNTIANRIAKQAMGVTGLAKAFAVCHIWPDSCYDVRYHTSLANLVLLPQALATLSDHNAAVIAALQYRAFELYGWHPRESAAPTRPQRYPSNWRSPQPAPAGRAARLARKLSASGGGMPNKPFHLTPTVAPFGRSAQRR
jgi:hypothetical protein